MLLQQSRYADAEREALLALAQSPDHPLAHAYLALSRTDQNKPDAIEAARVAVGLAPDVPFFRYVHAVVLHRSDNDRQALQEIAEAIRLDPQEENHFSLLASIHLGLRDWSAALEAAERGLALNPENVACANLRSMALVRLGRKDEAMQAVNFALQREPDNALSHANQGWNCLHGNEPRKAQEHFREALRLNPDLEYARHGMLEALKARNPVYRGMLAYFLWMGRQSGKIQAAFVIGTFVVIRGVRSFADAHPEWGVVLWPLVTLFYIFVYLSWTSVPMFNLLLRFDRFGRYVLSRDERAATNWFGACLALAISGLVIWARGSETGVAIALIGAALSICVAITYNRSGKARRWFAGGAIALGAIAVIGSGLVLAGFGAGAVMLGVFVAGFFGMQLAANFVRG